MRSNRSGFTLAELLVVFVILILVLFSLVPILHQMKVIASDVYSKNNLKQIGLAVHSANFTHNAVPPMFGEYGGSELGSFWYHLLPFIEQEYAHRKGCVESKHLIIKSLTTSRDPTLGNGTFELTSSSYLPFEGNPVPPWAESGNNQWALTSYGANWMVFGDSPKLLEATIKDGLSQTIMATEKYAVTSQSKGDPKSGATLWAYGWQVPNPTHQWAREPKQLKNPETVTKSLYQAPYWARSCYSGRPDADPTSWAKDQPWEFRGMLKPQFAPPVNESSPFREQGNFSQSINVLYADGSVLTVSPSISDMSWFALTGPDDGLVPQAD